MRDVSRIRLVIGTLGLLLLLFGVFRLLTQVPFLDLLVLAGWIVGAVVIHDGILSPIILAVGSFITGHLPVRGRRFVQGGLLAAALVTLVALPLILLQGSQPRSKAILDQDFTANLGILLAVIAVVTLLAYAVTRAYASRAKHTPPAEP